MILDERALRDDMKFEYYAAYFSEGFGPPLIESMEIENASTEELLQIAARMGIDLSEYMYEE